MARNKNVNYKFLFEKLHNRYDVVIAENNVYSTKAQYSVLDMDGFRDFSTSPSFPNKVAANNFVSS